MQPGVRFAPSPTGRLHIGNLRTAWVSYRIARVFALPWVVRFEDIDAPRVLAGALDQQLEDLRSLGLAPDHVVVQSQSQSRHLKWFEKARQEGRIYPCSCSRKEVQLALTGMQSAPHMEMPIYSGHCRDLDPSQVIGRSAGPQAWRWRSSDSSGARDFYVAREAASDGRAGWTPSYHWACALDDVLDLGVGYEWIVRGGDLESAADPQRQVQRWVRGSGPLPKIFHAAMVMDAEGARLEKRTHGVTLAEVGVEAAVRFFENSTLKDSELLNQLEHADITRESPDSLRFNASHR